MSDTKVKPMRVRLRWEEIHEIAANPTRVGVQRLVKHIKLIEHLLEDKQNHGVEDYLANEGE